ARVGRTELALEARSFMPYTRTCARFMGKNATPPVPALQRRGAGGRAARLPLRPACLLGSVATPVLPPDIRSTVGDGRCRNACQAGRDGGRVCARVFVLLTTRARGRLSTAHRVRTRPAIR